uniref:BHLH domain-containing protein n=1 Tax=Steinernema glaseri TaxID=37863 RepID=A0A1I7Z9Z2_9BILA
MIIFGSGQSCGDWGPLKRSELRFGYHIYFILNCASLFKTPITISTQSVPFPVNRNLFIFRVREPAKPGAATNPSKRHRERLNGELETVAALLPYESTVISRLDKLSVLRLAVSFLQVKAHFQACLHEYAARLSGFGLGFPATTIPVPSIVDPARPDQLLIDPAEPGFDAMASRALGGFVLILNAAGEIYYVSENIELYLGFHQSDILHQSLYDMIHSEDREDIRQQLQGPKGAKELDFEKNVCARFRCLLDNTCGFVVGRGVTVGGEGQVGGLRHPKEVVRCLIPNSIGKETFKKDSASRSVIKVRVMRVDIRGKIIPLFGLPPPMERAETPTAFGFAAICR